MMKLLHSHRPSLGVGVLGNQSNLMNKGMNQIESLPYEIMALLVCPHSKGKSSFFLFLLFIYFISVFPFQFFWFLLFLLRPPLPCFLPTWEVSLCVCCGGQEAWGGGHRIVVRCFHLVLASSLIAPVNRRPDVCDSLKDSIPPPPHSCSRASLWGNAQQGAGLVYHKSKQRCQRLDDNHHQPQ